MKTSLYTIANTRLTKLKNIGYDYSGNIFRKSMSPYLFADPTRSDILTEFEKIFQFMVEQVKLIKTFYNYTVPKDYSGLN